MNLHEHRDDFEDLLYTSERQSFAKAEQAFEYISHVFASIDE